MSLILAIEPDRRQVAQLTSIVRHVAGAELVLADTTERALESIGNGVPDLILVPALLSPQDDAALAAALRVIATAAHVQMLTIPTFPTAKPRQKSRGVLSAFRRNKASEDAPGEGCDPKVFAEQITSYLERANEERAAAQAYEDELGTISSGPAPAAEQTWESEPAAFESTSAPADEEAPAETWTAATVPAAEEYSSPVEMVESVRAAETYETVYVADVAAETYAAAPAAVEEAPAVLEQTDLPVVEDVYVEPVLEAPIAVAPEQAAPALDELVATLEQTEPVVEVEEVYAEPVPEIVVAAAPQEPAMALEEFVATLERTEPAGSGLDFTSEIQKVVPELSVADEAVAPLPALDEFLADFERANLPVIEEVRAEQWMADTVDPEDAQEDGSQEDGSESDIDLSIELEAVLHADAPVAPTAPPVAPVQSEASLKPFEPVVPVERCEPFPLAAWQNWPRLEETVSEAYLGNSSTDTDVTQFAEFEAALQESEPLEQFEPAVPVEAVEPFPLSTWRSWPRLEGVVAEAYQEPIAPRKAVPRPEWVELMRSLREDIARRRAELAQPAPIAAQPPQKAHRPRPEVHAQAAKPAPAVEPKTRPKRTRPIEDEWGLFDPEQCGFAALLDKLDEITVTPPGKPQPRREA